MYSALEIEVKDIYSQLHLDDMKPLNIEAVARHFDISLIYKSAEPKAISILNKKVIFLDERKDSFQQREDFCHELCHILKHTGPQNKTHYLFKQMQENQANAFMYHFAVPSFILNKTDMPNSIYEAVPFISRRFGVSFDFAHHRLEMFYRNLITYPNHYYWIKKKTSMEYAFY
ncbi:ImmA/IrrE family metallo-endopeptidase [Bacillus pumilus]|uniref:ImmA/IrrE family metallo-endopeptidase n=1 Tax=Bacillus pumilus TaxID=1408 RepID=UPI001E3F268B|nr:ImmA/IrrE family metallo-endopeptidase [Bacillus pumilus]